MTVSRYIRDKALSLAIAAVAIAAAALVMRAYAFDAGGIAFVCTGLAVAVLVALACDYLRRRQFYCLLARTLEQLDDSYLVADLVARPRFAEGALFYDALARATKAMNDRIGTYRVSSEEYREYVETWIHEIKTPIAAAHLIAENHGDPAVHAMDGEVERIERYVEQALFYSRSTNVEKDFALRKENVGGMVREALRANARLLIDAQVSPRLGPLDFEVYADRKWIVFILGQIFGNAVKYRKAAVGQGAGEGVRQDADLQDTDALSGDQQDAGWHGEAADADSWQGGSDRSDNGIQSVIRISAEQQDAGLGTASVVLAIEDNGIGVPAADVARVFDKGFTGENGRAFAKSTGIGLYLCRQLCLKMGLGISLDSRQGEGTRVSIVFPQNKMYFLQ